MNVVPPARVLVTGGAGYIGCVLVPRLCARGYEVTVLDALHFGEPEYGLEATSTTPRVIRGDIRDTENVKSLLNTGRFDAVIHLAAIANDPCADLDEEISRSTNEHAVRALMHAAKESGVRRFLYASSASVYGISDVPHVTEELELSPITIYARLKAQGEATLGALLDSSFCGVSVRAATVCGYSPRLRLDLTVNLLTEQAVKQRRVRVFGGTQERPNVHVQDLAAFYELLLVADADKVQGQAFNVSRENASVMSLAERVRDAVSRDLPIEIVPTEDRRSYRLSPDKARRVLGFEARHSIAYAIEELSQALTDGRVPDPENDLYRNVAFMRSDPERWSRLTPWGDS